MKKIVLLLVTLFSLNAVTYASFPVTSQDAEQATKQSLEENNFVDNFKLPNFTLVNGGGSGFSVAALCCGILGFFFLPFLLGPLAIVFGVMGMKRSGRGMAIAGLVLGIIQVAIVLLALLFIASLAASYGV